MSKIKVGDLARSPGRAPSDGRQLKAEVTSDSVLKNDRYYTTLSCEAVFHNNAVYVAQNVVDKAMSGDVAAMRICMDKTLPNAVYRPIKINLPKINTAEDALDAMRAVVQNVVDGKLNLVEAKELINAVEKLSENIQQAQDVKDLKNLIEELTKKVDGNIEARPE
jgi:hypothetical protein